MSNIGTIIRTMRLSRGLSQAQLADLAGLKRSAIGNYENGVREPDLDTIEALADAFNVSMSDLLDNGERDPEEEAMWTLREEMRRDPERRRLFKLAVHASIDDVKAADALLNALKATNPDFYDGDDPA